MNNEQSNVADLAKSLQKAECEPAAHPEIKEGQVINAEGKIITLNEE